MSDLFQEQLQVLRAQSLHRKLREIGTAQGPEVQMVGKQLANFSSNDYLGLANDPLLREAATAAIAEFGVGAGSSRLLSGTQSPHVRLEAALARWKGTPAALAFSSGYAAAVGTIPALVGKRDVILLDKFAHAALIDGAKLSGATIRVFPHNHLGKLESHLEWARREHPEARLLIVTESVFSMDGDRTPLRELVGLKKRFSALLLLDEAHAIGVIGAHGRGLAHELELTRHIDVQLGTLGKALGVSGGYICGSRSLIEWLVNRARSFIFSTASPPSLAAAATAAIEFLESSAGEERRLALWRNIAVLRAALQETGALPPSLPPAASPSTIPATKPEKRTVFRHFLTGTRSEQANAVGLVRPAEPAQSGSAIHPIIIGDEQTAIDLANSLHAEGFLVPAIRYPTVAKGAARLRVTVTAAHEEAQIRALAGAISRLQPEAIT
ncbi:MAG TPA: 8-amino-7-oxononanoate synthase [Chthoniobacterales bacterium]|nr:8-amino-7-oxononanoate synthase [Chthoniobacterales bacterium]